MLMPTSGNLREVYLHCVRQAELATERAMKDPINAELIPERQPHWHVITIMSGHEGIASGHLIGRRFGVFDPIYKEDSMVRGRLVTRTKRLIPGYLLVFVWSIQDHWNRIRACPGVLSILTGANGEPSIVPDWVIDDLRRWELAHSPVAADLAAIAYREDTLAARPSLTRKQKRYRKEQAEAVPQAEQPKATEFPYSVFNGFDGLDPDERISRFRETIGVGS